MRLFGNIMSGHLVVGLLVALTGLLVPIPFMALELLIGLLQAYIFASTFDRVSLAPPSAQESKHE